MAKNYLYHAYGLNIDSTLKFPELMHGKSDIDVIIHFNAKESLFYNVPPNKSGLSEISFSTNDILYFFDNEPIFRIRYGKEILINPKTNLDLILLRYLILCQGFGTLFMQRGYLVLHASSIRIENEAIAFIGKCGNGKSTIAAAMNKLDFSTVTDDVLVLKFNENNNILVLPSFPRLKLCNDICNHITNRHDSLTQIHQKIDKHSLNVSKTFSIKPLLLQKIYILEKSTKNEITSVKPQEALIELIKNSYAINLFGDYERSHNLIQCAELVKNVSIKCLKSAQSLDKLSNLTQIIVKDVFTD